MKIFKLIKVIQSQRETKLMTIQLVIKIFSLGMTGVGTDNKCSMNRETNDHQGDRKVLVKKKSSGEMSCFIGHK